MKRLVLTVLIISISLTTNALALEVPSRPIGRISDYTNTLKNNEIQELEQTLAQFERETTNQIAVLLIPTLAGDNLEDYSIRLADKWKIGQKGKDNGVILLIVKQDRKIRIEVGYGLEGVLPDSRAGKIIRKNLAPHFREGNFFGGIKEGIISIITAITGEYQGTGHRYENGYNRTEYHPISDRDFSTVFFKAYENFQANMPRWLLYPALIMFAFALFIVGIALFFALFGSVFFEGGPSDYNGFDAGFSGGGGGFGGGGASGDW